MASECVISPACFVEAARSDSALNSVLLCVRIARACEWAGGCVISPACFVKAGRYDSEMSPVVLCIEFACADAQMSVDVVFGARECALLQTQ